MSGILVFSSGGQKYQESVGEKKKLIRGKRHLITTICSSDRSLVEKKRRLQETSGKRGGGSRKSGAGETIIAILKTSTRWSKLVAAHLA